MTALTEATTILRPAAKSITIVVMLASQRSFPTVLCFTLAVLVICCFSSTARAQTGWVHVRQHEGAESDQLLGFAVCALGDINADGYSDYAASAPKRTPPGGPSRAGTVFVYSGFDGNILWEASGPENGSWFGSAICLMPDIDGDGAGELVVGATGVHLGSPVSAGGVFALSGSSGSEIWRRPGLTDREALGASVAVIGDITGDGVPDVVAGAPAHDRATVIQAGAAYIISGSDGIILHVLEGNRAQQGMGRAVCGPGDLNGDGTPDFLVAADEQNPAARGSIAAYSGASGVRLWKEYGTWSSGYGHAVVGIEDKTGDGLSDVLVGAGNWQAPSADGAIFILRGTNGASVWSLADSIHSLGTSVAEIGDLDGDGGPEIATGAPGHYIPPDAHGAVLVISNDHEWAIGNPFDGGIHGAGDFGTTIASVTGLDGFSSPGLIVGSELSDPGGKVGAGIVHIYTFMTDSDDDQLADALEAQLGSDPFDRDSDDDGLGDGEEHDHFLTDLLISDSDLDALPDGLELGRSSIIEGDPKNGILGTDPDAFVPDADPTTTTDPITADSDGGGLIDGQEDTNGNGVIDIGEKDPLDPLDDGLFLQVSELFEGQAATASGHSDAQGGTAHFAYSFTGTGPTMVRHGILVDLSRPIFLLGSIAVDGQGLAQTSFEVPHNSAGTTVFFQVVESNAASFRVSNVVVRSVQ